MKYQSLDELLDQVRRVVENVKSHPQVSVKMAEFGYHGERLQEGKVLYETIAMLQMQQEDCYSKEQGINSRLNADLEAVKALYAEHLEIARFTFRNDPEMERKLELKGVRKRSQVKLCSQMRKFYIRTEAVMTPLKKHGAHLDEFVQAREMVEAIIGARDQRMQCQGDAQDATQKRDALVKELREWLADFRKVARVALKKESQLLEAFGITVPAVR